MADQVLKARDEGVTFDIGIERPDGSYAVASFDEDSYNKLVEILAALGAPLQEGGTVSLSASTLTALQSINVLNFPLSQTVDTDSGPIDVQGTIAVTGPLTNAELRDSPVVVDIGSGSVEVANLQQLSVVVLQEVSNHDLAVASYDSTSNATADSLLGGMVLKFSSTETRTITVTINGSVFINESDSSLEYMVDFEDFELDQSDSVRVQISQTSGPCTVNVLLTSKIGTSALGGNPVLGESTATIGNVGLEVFDSAVGDAFGRMRVSHPYSQFEVHHQWDLSPLYVGQTADSTGTVTHKPPAARLTVGPGEVVKHQSHQYAPYQSGKGRLVRITSVYHDHVADVSYTSIYGDDDDGVGASRLADGTLAVILRSSSFGEQTWTRNNWNIDKLDGTGPSGLNISDAQFSSGIHFVVDFEWLSIGRVRWGFNVGGLIYYVHQFDAAFNAGLVGPYMRTGSLPVRWEIVNNSTTETAFMDAVCASVVSEGGHQPEGLLWSANSNTSKTVTTARTPLLSIRPRATFNGLDNHGSILPGDFGVLGGGDLIVEVYIAGNVTGTWQKADPTTSPAADGNSHAEYCIPTGFTGGRRIASQLIGAGKGGATGSAASKVANDLLLFVTSNGFQLPLTVCARTFSGTTTASAYLQWVETR